MQLSQYTPMLILLALTAGCQQEAARISELETAGATVSKGLDGSVTTVRFLTSNIASSCVESLQGISTLKQIHGAGPELTDAEVSQLAELPVLEALALPQSKAAAATIAAIAKSSTLRSIDFSGATSLSDEVIKGLQDHPHLKILNLSNTPLTDASIETISSISNLEELSLVGTKITTAAMVQLAESIPDLKLLAIGSDTLTDEIVPATFKFKSLETLEIVNSGLTGATLGALSGHPTLRKINLSGNTQLTNDNIMQLGQLQALENLNVEGSLFSSAGFNQSGFRKLSTLIANGTKVTDEDIANFAGVPVLYSVKVKATSVTEAGVRKHFAPTSQTGFEWDVQ